MSFSLLPRIDRLSAARMLDGLRAPAARRLAFVAALVFLAPLSACSDDAQWHGTDVSGAMPDLDLTMTRAADGKTVTEDDYRGKIAMIYFGYTFCPDICPLTLANVTQALKKMGDKAKDVRLLFVTVDPKRDTLDVLKDYTEAFAPQMVGLRGTDDQIAALAKRYRAAYSVVKDAGTGDVVVTHSPTIYAFDRQGRARLLFTNFSGTDADVDGMAADLERLADAQGESSWWDWF